MKKGLGWGGGAGVTVLSLIGGCLIILRGLWYDMEGVTVCTLNPYLGTKISHLRYEICSLCLMIIEVIIYGW